MPFEKQADGSYRSPSGRRYTAKQVRYYHAHNGFPDSQTDKAPKKKRTRKARQ